MRKLKSEKMNIGKIYIVKYSCGDYDDYIENTIFATLRKSTATKYITRYNRILKKWKDYYRQFEGNECGMRWIKEEFSEGKFDRWYKLFKAHQCFYEELEIR